MASSVSSPARTVFFLKLKPCCVGINELALKPSRDGRNAKELARLTSELLVTLRDQVADDPSVLDHSLAEYVFFPLGHIFRNLERYPMPLVETVIQCLETLVVRGWGPNIRPEFAQKLLGLLSFVIDGPPGESSKGWEVPEETVIVAFDALTALLDTLRQAPTGSTTLTELATMPILGHSITIMLEGINEGKSPESQIAALRALDTVYRAVRDHEALATFLPGTISALTKLLSAPARQKKKVLVTALRTTQHVLIQVLGDIRMRNVIGPDMVSGQNEQNETTSEVAGVNAKVLSSGWHKATSAQIKLALSTILRLRRHDEESVQLALYQLCLSLLDECHLSLRDCSSILMETAIILEPPRAEKDGYTYRTKAVDLAIIYPELAEGLKTSLYNWSMSLPRLVQSQDDAVRLNAIRTLSKGLNLMQSLYTVNSSTLRDSMSSALRESIASVVESPRAGKLFQETSEGVGSWQGMSLAVLDEPKQAFSPVILSQQGQATTRNEIFSLLASIGSSADQARLAAEYLGYVRHSTGPTQIASYWLSYQLLRLALEQAWEPDELYLNFASFNSPIEEPETLLYDLYQLAVSIVDSHSEPDEVDWRLQAISVEIVSFTASRQGPSFRPELIDVLYPITTYLGHGNQQLRDHAIVSLNMIGASCGYGSVSQLIVNNVDYLVNSVALRLNILDIPPASIQVLIAMVRLAGPKVIPYLDDVVRSIFSALDNHHGYPAFVESLFGVLREIVNQGVKSDALLLEGQKTADHRKKTPMHATLDDMIARLEARKQRKDERDREDREADDCISGHPTTPWRSDESGRKDGSPQELSEPNAEEEKPPSRPTYQLLLKIADLAQHYLTSPAPTLRKSLLDLVATVSPALAGDEDRFLPLINSVWPVVVGRLYDSEPYVAVSACDAICVLCAAGGDFMGTRIKTEWEDRLGKWCRTVKQRGLQASQGGGASHGRGTVYDSREGDNREIRIPGKLLTGTEPTGALLTEKLVRSDGLGRFAQPVRVWEGTVKLLVSIISHVRVEDEMFDEIVEILVDTLSKDVQTREALSTVNADAVWLAMYEHGLVEWKPRPTMDGVAFSEMVKTSF